MPLSYKFYISIHVFYIHKYIYHTYILHIITLIHIAVLDIYIYQENFSMLYKNTKLHNFINYRDSLIYLSAHYYLYSRFFYNYRKDCDEYPSILINVHYLLFGGRLLLDQMTPLN